MTGDLTRTAYRPAELERVAGRARIVVRHDSLEEIIRAIQSSDVRLVVGRVKFVRYAYGRIAVLNRVGKGERWELAPSRDLYVTSERLPVWFPREARVWISRLERFDVAGHARAMSARVL